MPLTDDQLLARNPNQAMLIGAGLTRAEVLKRLRDAQDAAITPEMKKKMVENLFARLKEQSIVVTFDKVEAENLVKNNDWHVGETLLHIKRQQRLQRKPAPAEEDPTAADADGDDVREVPSELIGECSTCGHYRTCSWCKGQTVAGACHDSHVANSIDHLLDRAAPTPPAVALETVIQKRRQNAKSFVDANAGQGCAWAQYARGLAYSKGDVLAKDDARAAELFELAAAQGYAPAQCTLGQLCQQGSAIVPQDLTRAASLYAAAVGAGLAQAQCNLARMHLNGVGVKRDYAFAAELFQRAADQGHAQAKRHLGMLYQQGRGVEQDQLGTADDGKAAALLRAQ